MKSTTITAPPEAPPRTAPAARGARPLGIMGALLERHGQFLLYAVIGVGALLIDVGTFAALVVSLDWHPLLANTVSTVLAAVASFLANSFGNFKVTDRLFVRFISFGLVAGLGYLVSTLIVGVGVGIFSFDPLIAKALSLPFVLVLQFVLNKTITFGSSLGRTPS